MKITDFVTSDNICDFSHYRQGYLYYIVANKTDAKIYSFPVPIEDLAEATIHSKEKSVFMMRYIRKAITDGTIVKVN
jgi:hypothetical protein